MSRKANPILGVIAGLAVASLTSLVALMIFFVRGPEAFTQFGTSIWATLGVYMTAGIVGGAVVGTLLPLTVWRVGAVFVGMLAAAPLYLGIAALLGQPDLSSGLLAAAFVGGIVGYGLWSPAIASSEDNDRARGS